MPDAANPSGYMIDSQTLLPSVLAVGSGTILTDVNGYAIIKNLPPGKYGVTLLPPNGSDWIQTSTIEGQHANDAWVKFKEPPYFAEYGPPGPHVFSGFVSPTQSVPAGALNGSATVKGRIVVNHMNRPPNFGFYTGPQADYTTCWIGLNATGSGANQAIYARACNPDGTFQIAGVPPGAYQIAVWDTALDLIHGSYGVTVNADGSTCATDNGSCDLGDIPMFTWFTRIESKVFFDAAKTGFPAAGAIGIPEIPVTIRFRDGSVDQTFKTRDDGVATFNEAFPYFNWQVIEVDSARLKPTGVTVVVDAGGPIPPDNGWTMPSEGKLNPQPQQVWNARAKTLGGRATNPNTGNNLSRTDAGPITTQTFQGFTTGTNIIDFGKAPYTSGENGGISGMVAYATVRAEDDPRYAVIEGLEPGIPRVAVIVYPKPAAGTRLNLSDVAAYTNTPDMNWRSTASDGINAKAGDAKRSKNGGATVFDYGDAIAYGYTDGWDDTPPTGCQGEIYVATAGATKKPTDCYDGLRNFNQVRPGTYDGHYQILKDIHGQPLPAGEYVVEVFAPRIGAGPSPYKIIKEEDKNVFFGVDFVPAQLPAACVGDQVLVDPNQFYYGRTTGTPLVTMANYPMPHVVPPYLSLFPSADPGAFPKAQPPKATPLAGQTRPLCNFKAVTLSNGQNAKASYEFYTDVPIAAHFVGIILNDLGNEFDITAPTFGEKQAPSWLPIAIRDWTGQELYRIHSDEWGTYSGVVPSTITASVPIPSGNSPSIMTLCMNDPGPVPDPAHPGQTMIDPHFNRQYSQFCYTLSYLQGTTTYLDTPVIPVAAFVGAGQSPLDCEFVDGTPKVFSVANTTSSIPGPVVIGVGPAVLTIVSDGNAKVPNPEWKGQGSGTATQVTRDYGFGRKVGKVTIGGVNIPVTGAQWSQGIIQLNVPAGAAGGELVITRGDNGLSTITSVTVLTGVAAAQVHVVKPSVGVSTAGLTPISDAIAASNPGDVVVLAPGGYQEMVIIAKPVQLAGSGPGSVSINPAKTRTDALQTWRDRVRRLLTSTPTGADLLPGQALDFTVPEPGTLNTEEGAGILVLGKAGLGSAFATNPSRIDGITFFGADHGGAITVNGYAHKLEISNNHVTANAGFYGGIRIGVPLLVNNDLYVSGQNEAVKIHNNAVTQNGGQGSSGGGISLCTGADGYKVTGNFVCGNFNSGDGGGIGHVGLSNNGLIANNTVLFNQVFDQSRNDNGGGISVASETALAANGLATGTGSVLIVNNTIQGNQAGSGNGGGISLNAVNGQDVAASPGDPSKWYRVTMVNNIVVDNMAALAGGGISLQDVASGAIVNDTVANNDSTATAADAFSSPLKSASQSNPQVAGIVSHGHSAALLAALAQGGAAIGTPASAPLYAGFSNPDLRNSVVFQNRSFYFRVDAPVNNLPTYSLQPPVATPNYSDLGVIGAAGPAA